MSSVFRNIVLVCWLSMFDFGLGGKSANKTKCVPLYGWCRTKHDPKRPAQSGHDGYCKACYKARFPNKYAAKQANIKKSCGFCRELRHNLRAGVCKPCRAARACGGCGDVNLNAAAASCMNCYASRQQRGASQTRLAMWCASCHQPFWFASMLNKKAC